MEESGNNVRILSDSYSHQLTIDDIFKYVEVLTECVEKQITESSSDSDKKSLIYLKELLKENHVRKLVDGLKQHKVIISEYHKIAEIDDLLDELYLHHLKLPYPTEYFLKEQRKKDRAHRMTLMILLLGLCGFEWVVS